MEPLASTSTTSNAWSQSYTHDAFSNLTGAHGVALPTVDLSNSGAYEATGPPKGLTPWEGRAPVLQSSARSRRPWPPPPITFKASSRISLVLNIQEAKASSKSTYA